MQLRPTKDVRCYVFARKCVGRTEEGQIFGKEQKLWNNSRTQARKARIRDSNRQGARRGGNLQAQDQPMMAREIGRKAVVWGSGTGAWRVGEMDLEVCRTEMVARSS